MRNSNKINNKSWQFFRRENSAPTGRGIHWNKQSGFTTLGCTSPPPPRDGPKYLQSANMVHIYKQSTYECSIILFSRIRSNKQNLWIPHKHIWLKKNKLQIIHNNLWLGIVIIQNTHNLSDYKHLMHRK